MHNKRKYNRSRKTNNKSQTKAAILEAYQEIQTENSIKHYPTELLKVNLDLIFYVLKFVLGSLGIAFLVAISMLLKDGINLNNLVTAIVGFFIAILCFIFTIICHKTSKALVKESDKNYIVSYFSAMVSFVALIVALISIISSNK